LESTSEDKDTISPLPTE